MIAVDTNVLARFLLKDHPAQFRRAVAVLQSGDEIFIPVTVLLELAWVLKSREVTSEEIAASLRGIMTLPHVRLQHAESIRAALGWADEGMDVADALHLSLSAKASRFVTFDTTLRRSAAKLDARPEVTAP